jgi:hypothetical protein
LWGKLIADACKGKAQRDSIFQVTMFVLVKGTTLVVLKEQASTLALNEDRYGTTLVVS